MQNGFIDSTLERNRTGLQAERQRYRRHIYTEYGHTQTGTLSVTRLLTADARQSNATLNLGVKGDGALIGRDLYQVRGSSNSGNSNRFPEGDFLARQVGKGAVDLCLSQTSTTSFSSIYNVKTARADYSVLLGGQDNNINSTNATYAAIVGGNGSYVSAQGSAALGGNSISINGVYSAGIGGQANNISASYSAAIGGTNNQLNSQYSATLGGRSLQTYAEGEVAHGGCYIYSGRTYTVLIHLQGMSGSNSGNSTCYLSTNEGQYYSGAEGSNNILYIPDYTTVAFQGTLIGQSTTTSACKAYSIRLTARKAGNQNSTTALLGEPVIDTLYSESADNWTFAIGAYTSNTSGVSFSVNTGSTNVRWSLSGTVNRLSLQ